jgi:hypothetical protein
MNLERSNGERLSKIYYDKYRKGLGNEKFKKYNLGYAYEGINMY